MEWSSVNPKVRCKVFLTQLGRARRELNTGTIYSRFERAGSSPGLLFYQVQDLVQIHQDTVQSIILVTLPPYVGIGSYLKNSLLPNVGLTWVRLRVTLFP